MGIRRVPVIGVVAIVLSAAAFADDAAEQLQITAVTEVASGRGERGAWQQNDSRYDYVDDPAVAIDDRGTALVAWVDQGRKDLFLRRFPSSGKPSEATAVSRNPETFSWLPRLVTAGSGRIYLLWQEIIFSGGSHGGDILFTRSEDNGESFTHPRNLSNSRGGDGKGRITREIWHNGSLDLAAAPDGAVYAAWTEYAGTLWFSRSADDGNTFAPPRPIAGSDGSPARAPALAIGRGRTVYLAWTVGEDKGADIRVARSDNGGATFSQVKIVARSPGYSDAPKLAVGADGVLHLVYGESSGGPFERQQVRYTSSSDGGRTFAPPRVVSHREALPGQGAGFPALAVDGNDRVYVLWERFPQGNQDARGLGLAVSPDGGRSFSPAAEIPDSADPEGINGSRQGLLMKKLAVNRRGEVAIVNSSLKQNERSRVWLIRGKLNRTSPRRLPP